MPAKNVTYLDRPMTAAERKARQRAADRRRGTASAEAIDATLVETFKAQCRIRSAGRTHRDLDLTEIAQLVASEFSTHEKLKVFDRLGLRMDVPPGRSLFHDPG